MINYIIPIKNPELIEDKQQFTYLLDQTLGSINRQKKPGKIYISASPGTPLPKLPEIVNVVSVESTGVNIMEAENQEQFYKLIRKDKGIRVRAAINMVESDDDYVMVVDDDDVIHKDLSSFIIENDQRGYVIKTGYMHRISDDSFFRMDNFNTWCGTSVVVRKGMYLYRDHLSGKRLNDAIAELGSHLILPGRHNSEGNPLTEVPFRAAIYCTGNKNSTQKIIAEKFGKSRSADMTKAKIEMKATSDDLELIRDGFGILPHRLPL